MKIHQHQSDSTLNPNCPQFSTNPTPTFIQFFLPFISAPRIFLEISVYNDVITHHPGVVNRIQNIISL